MDGHARARRMIFVIYALAVLKITNQCKIFQFKIVNIKTGLTSCQDCKKCHRGFEAYPACDMVAVQNYLVKQLCRKCEPNTFKLSYSELSCIPCSLCPKHRATLQDCSPYSDTRCDPKCVHGKYMSHDKLCYPCCRCQDGNNYSEPLCANVQGKNCQANTSSGSCPMIITTVATSTVKSQSPSTTPQSHRPTTAPTTLTNILTMVRRSKKIKKVTTTQTTQPRDIQTKKVVLKSTIKPKNKPTWKKDKKNQVVTILKIIAYTLAGTTGIAVILLVILKLWKSSRNRAGYTIALEGSPESKSESKAINRCSESISLSDLQIPLTFNTQSSNVEDGLVLSGGTGTLQDGGQGRSALIKPSVDEPQASDHSSAEGENQLPEKPAEKTVIHFHGNVNFYNNGAESSQKNAEKKKTVVWPVLSKEQIKNAKNCPGPCGKEIGDETFVKWIRENPEAFDLVKAWLENEAETCKRVLEYLVDNIDQLDVHCVTNGESLILKLSTAYPRLRLSSFLFVLEQLNQIELVKSICNKLHS